MPRKRLYSMKFKLGVLLFSVVLMMSGFLGVCQYIFTRVILEDHFDTSRKLIRDRVLNIVSNADRMNLLLESPLEKEGRDILEAVKTKYKETGSINFSLEPFVAGKEGTDVYIIDHNQTVVAATNQNDLGLNFKPWPHFTGFLERVTANDVFATSRMSLSLNGGNMTKYCYLPSGDGKYVFETGSLPDSRELDKKGSAFDHFEEQVVRDTDFVDRVTLFDYKGVSYKKSADGINETVAPEHASAFDTAMSSLQTVEQRGKYEGRSVIYQFIPYEIIGANGINERNVIEVIYNDHHFRSSLESSSTIIALLILLAALLAGSFGWHRAKGITRPIETIMNGMQQVSAGQYDVSLPINSRDEFMVMGRQFEHMAQDIKVLLEERSRNERELEEKNEEISQQKEEITTLFEELEGILQENQNSYFETVRALANAIEAKDKYTGGHCERVMEYSTAIGQAMGLNGQQLYDLRFGSILHDIGKIGIPEHILNNKGSFSEEEFTIMKQHPEIGDHLLKDLQFLANSRKIVYEHHERMDGRGYPLGIKGDQIGLLSKIVCVADSYDAMTSARPYRDAALTQEQAISELRRNSGSQFDPQVVDAFTGWLTNHGGDNM